MWLFVVVGAFELLLGCLGEDVTSGPATATADAGASSEASATDGSAATEGSAATDGGLPAASVVPRGDFESAGCLGWTANEARLSLEPDAHGGSFSCRVCATGTTPVWGIFQEVPTVPPGSYFAEAHFRAAGDAGPFSAVVRLEASAGGEPVGSARDGTATFAPGEPWAKATTELAIETGQALGVALLSQTEGGCFLVDDVSVVGR